MVPAVVSLWFIIHFRRLDKRRINTNYIKACSQIVLTERLTCASNIEEFCYVYLLLNASWRSDEEMKVEHVAWLIALEFHGLSLPAAADVLLYYQLLSKLMFISPRYSQNDITRSISMMNYDMTIYLEKLKTEFSNDIQIKIDSVITEIKIFAHSTDEHVVDINMPDIEIDFGKFIYLWNKTGFWRIEAKRI